MATPKQARAAHKFGKSRPSGDGNFNIHVETPQATRDVQFRPLPDPIGSPPFHLDLADIISAEHLADIKAAKKLTFHVNGDMGGIQFAVPQQLVAKGMEDDFDPAAKPSENPAFLYILGDCVYFNGEIAQYRAQFFEPYAHYLAPIFSVPGNHDGENLPDGNTLDGFMRFFCSTCATILPEAGDTERTTMTQPNVYWTLRTPLVSIVGLYSNVPEGGDIRSPQTEWLAEQLRSLPKNLPVFVSLHHPVYSADIYHSGSTRMKDLIEAAAEQAGRHPDMVLAGHVHNYQRITKDMSDGTVVPFIVAGAGGYHNLHAIVKVDGQKMVTPATFVDKEGESVTLEKYSDDHHGFFRLEVTDTTITGRYYTVPRPQDPYSKGSSLLDYFEYDWKRHQYLPNTLSASAGASNEVSVAKKRPVKNRTSK